MYMFKVYALVGGIAFAAVLIAALAFALVRAARDYARARHAMRRITQPLDTGNNGMPVRAGVPHANPHGTQIA